MSNLKKSYQVRNLLDFDLNNHIRSIASVHSRLLALFCFLFRPRESDGFPINRPISYLYFSGVSFAFFENANFVGIFASAGYHKKKMRTLYLWLVVSALEDDVINGNPNGFIG